jgi:hypothetical protein
MNPKYSKQKVFGYWVNGLQKGQDSETWIKMFFEEKPAELILAKTLKP